MGATGRVTRRWGAVAAIAVFGALGFAGCGGDDDDVGAAETQRESPNASTDEGDPPADPVADTSGVASGSATIGTTMYTFVPGDGAFCRIDEGAQAVSISGLIDPDTGAELSVDYSIDSLMTAHASVSIDDGPDLESSSAVVSKPPTFVLVDDRAVGGGQFIDVADPGSEPITGQLVIHCGG